MQTREPFFSVVIPTLNEEKYLPKLLVTLEKQIDRDFEVVVVDGASKDKTVEKAKEFERRWEELRVVATGRSNQSWQRNEGARLARGRFLVFLDADGLVPANFLSEVHHYLLKNKGCRFLTTWMKADSEEASDKAVVMLVNMAVEMSKAVEKHFVPGANMVVEKKLFFKAGGFDEKVNYAEDYELTQRIVRMGGRLHILKSPRPVMSLRRFRREGKLRALHKLASGTVKTLIEGPVVREMFDYQMGGKVRGKNGR